MQPILRKTKRYAKYLLKVNFGLHVFLNSSFAFTSCQKDKKKINGPADKSRDHKRYRTKHKSYVILPLGGMF